MEKLAVLILGAGTTLRSCSTTAFDCLAFRSAAAGEVAPWLITPTYICMRSGCAETVASPCTRMYGTVGGIEICCAARGNHNARSVHRDMRPSYRSRLNGSTLLLGTGCSETLECGHVVNFCAARRRLQLPYGERAPYLACPVLTRLSSKTFPGARFFSFGSRRTERPV